MTTSIDRNSAICRAGRALGALALAATTLAPATAAYAAERPAQLARAAVTDTVTFSVYLPLQHKAELETLLAAQQDPKSPSYRKWLSAADFDKRFGPSASTLATVKTELQNAGLTVTAVRGRELQVSGSAAMAEHLLNVPLQRGVYSNGRVAFSAAGTPSLPSALQTAGAKIVGLSGMIRMASHAQKVQVDPSNRYSNVGPYWFDDLKQAYKFPSSQALSGKGSTIGILMSGGYSQADMDLYFGHEKLKSPKYFEVKVNGGAPFDANDDGSFEATLDLQQTGGMAPASQIVLYSIPTLSDNNIIDGLLNIVEDDAVDVVSMSFGGAEVYYTAAWNGGMDYTYLLQVEHELFLQGNAQGITFVASSGDNGAIPAGPPACFTLTTGGDCGRTVRSVESPASDPAVTGVGGTNLVTTFRTGDLNSAYVSERARFDLVSPHYIDEQLGTYATGFVWASGGGSSVIWAKPDFQQLVQTNDKNWRTVPDVSLHMGGCPNGAVRCAPADSADLEFLGGQLYGVIGTSASAPDFAGLAALGVQQFGTRLGNLNSYIYTLSAAQSSGALPFKVYNWGIDGDNGYYRGTPTGYNRVLGNGTVNGVNFLLAPTMPVAGVPRSPSNP